MKKTIHALLSIILTVTLLSVICGVAAYAEDTVYTENGVHYKLLADKTASVIGSDENISEITIPDKLKNGYNVESIESEAFQGNLDLKTVVCSADIRSIGDYAFESCAQLKTASFTGNAASVGKCAFSFCSSLTKIELPDSVTKIGDGAFLLDRELRSFRFPASLVIAGEFAFAQSGLQKAEMNCHLTTIPDRMFFMCESLSQVKLPVSLKTIDDYAFYGCESLSLSSIPKTVDVIGRSAFYGCLVSNLHLNCSQIKEKAFAGCYEMQSVTFSDNVKKIEAEAFVNAAVGTFDIPEKAELESGALTAVNTSAFAVSKTDDRFTVKDGVLFSEDMKTLIAYPNGRTAGNGVYTVPDGVQVIAPHAFDSAWMLTEVKLPDTVSEIGNYAFCQSGIEKMTIPDKVKAIGDGTFRYCSSLEKIDLGKIEKIGELAFRQCSEITLELPETLTEIDPLAFADSDVKLKADGNYKIIDGVLYTADGKTLVCYPKQLEAENYTIPDGVETISEMAFASNGNIKSVNIPESLVSIGNKGIGYTVNFDSGFEKTPLTDGFVIIGKASENVRKYAKDNNIGVFLSSDHSQNIKEAVLSGNETAQFLINNADPSDVIYTSNDDRIASVSKNGTITGLSKGTTYITAAVGMTYFKCKVTVTSDSGAEYKGFDESKYVKITQDSYKSWESEYRAANPYLTEKLVSPNSSPAVSAYQSQSYFEAMFGADAPESHYHNTGIAMFGDGFEMMIEAVSHACDAELKRYHNTDDMLLYSGADNYTTSLAAQGKPATVENMRSAVGTTFTYPLFTSTTLDEIVSHRFYSGRDGVLMIIYADKDALDKQHAGYIGTYHGDIEYELLISHGAKFEVIDAGVRYVSREGFREDDEKLDTFERYVKLKLVSGEAEPVSDTDTSEKSNSSVQSKSTDSDRSISSAQSKSTDSDKSSTSAQSKNTVSNKKNSAVSSKKTASQKSNSSGRINNSKLVSSNRSIRNIFTGDQTSHIVFAVFIILAVSFAAVAVTAKKDKDI